MSTKLIENYHYAVTLSGIGSLVITTRERRIGYHQYSDNEIKIFYDQESGTEEEYLIIPELKFEKPHMKCYQQDKDQLYIYYIPIEMLTRFDKTSIITSK